VIEVAETPLFRLLETATGVPAMMAPFESFAVTPTVTFPLSGTVVTPEYERVVPTT